MKFLKQHTLLGILAVSLVLFSCQKEESEFIDENPTETITNDSALAKLLVNTSQNDGTIDDFIDGTSCSSIQFPYQIVINGQTVTIESVDDVTALSGTTSAITIVYPITVVFEDYSTLVVEDQAALNALAQACTAFENAISCIDVVYPITLFTYNSANEQTGTTAITSDAELFGFFTSLNPDDYVAIEYPISVVLADGTTLAINSNTELQNAIENCDTTTEPTDPADLETVLTTDSWYITYFFDDEDETYHFQGYEFVFNQDGTVTASNGSTTVNGTWSITNSSSSQTKLNLDFGDDDPFEELEEDWKLIDFSEEMIRLFDVSGGDGTTEYLTFSRTENDGGSEAATELKNTLIDGNWFVSLYLDDGEDDETSDYDSFTFNFLESGEVEASNSSTTLTGSWTVIGNDSHLKLILNFNDVYPLDDLDDDWDVFSVAVNEVKLRDDNDDDADILIFEKL